MLLEISLWSPIFLSIIILATTILFFILKALTKHNPTGNTKKLPPSPPSLPVIGNLHQLGLQPHRALQALSRRYGHDGLMLLRLGSVPVMVVSSAEAAAEVMKTHDLVFSDRPKALCFEKLLYNYKDISTAPYGEYWRQTKSISVLHLLSKKRVRSFRDVREEEIKLMAKSIGRSCSLSEPVNLSELFAGLTNDVVCRVAFGRKYNVDGERGSRFKGLLCEFTELLGGFNVGDYIPMLSWLSRVNGSEARMDRVAKELDEFLERVVQEHIMEQEQRVGDNEYDRSSDEDQEDRHKNFVDILLWVQRENLLGFPIDTTCVKALILDMFAAGTDTTYTFLEWAMTELLNHPKAMEQLQNEVRSVTSHKADVTEDDIEHMPYLKAVLKETIRLHPPLPLLFPRASTHDVDLMGFHVPAGCQVFTNAWAIGRDPSAWGPRGGSGVDEFCPERFLGGGGGVDYKGHDFGLIPFGAGRRGCPGILFAEAVSEIALASVVRNFDWSIPGGGDLDMAETIGLTTHRKFPLMALPRLAS